MSRVRAAAPTVAFVDEYCAHYRALFANVRHFEQFTRLHLGLLAETKRKSLPRIAKAVQADHQALHHFLAKAGWSVDALRARRLALLQQAAGDRPLIVCLDETGDRKKGQSTDYAARQYIGNVGGLANGVVSVNAYGVLGATTFPLTFRFFKPKARLKEGDVYRSKPLIAVELLEELCRRGFRIGVVLADSLYGESGDVTRALYRLKLPYVVAIRSNHLEPSHLDVPRRAQALHAVAALRARLRRRDDGAALHPRDRLRPAHARPLLPAHHRPAAPARGDDVVPQDQPAGHDRADGRQYVRPAHAGPASGFKHAKDELGWADYRLTDAHSIARWWELVMCAYLLVSLQAPALAAAPAGSTDEPAPPPAAGALPAGAARQHPAWTDDASWKHRLTNLRVFLQPFVCACLLLPWLRIHALPHLAAGLADLCALMNTYHPALPI